MLGFLQRKPMLDADTAEWLFAAFEWAQRNFAQVTVEQPQVLVEPTARFFPDQVSDEADVAPVVFERVKKLAGMATWPCELAAQEPELDPRAASRGIGSFQSKSPAGTFHPPTVERSHPIITYAPRLVREPQRLVATLAHELAHYLDVIAKEDPPGGAEYHEQATDFLVIFLGFGLFTVNSSFSFRGYRDDGSGTQGWMAQTLGYLAPKESAFALAVYCSVHDVESSIPKRHLGDPQRSFFFRSLDDLARHAEWKQRVSVLREAAKAAADGRSI